MVIEMELQKFKELIKDEYEEYTPESSNLPLGHFIFNDTLGGKYFKPKQKFPVVFENEHTRIIVNDIGLIKIIDRHDDDSISLHPAVSLPLLEQAIELSKKLREKK